MISHQCKRAITEFVFVCTWLTYIPRLAPTQKSCNLVTKAYPNWMTLLSLNSTLFSTLFFRFHQLMFLLVFFVNLRMHANLAQSRWNDHTIMAYVHTSFHLESVKCFSLCFKVSLEIDTYNVRDLTLSILLVCP